VGNTYDPNTPYENSISMSKQLARARLLTLDGYGHTALENPSSCVQAYESRYLINLTLPPTGAICHQNQQPFSIVQQR
jgi:hypothetical protein